jgi:hypothetical protein
MTNPPGYHESAARRPQLSGLLAAALRGAIAAVLLMLAGLTIVLL